MEKWTKLGIVQYLYFPEFSCSYSPHPMIAFFVSLFVFVFVFDSPGITLSGIVNGERQRGRPVKRGIDQE